ncbi:uncharacterized protein LOC122009316 isoform X2 [Zingiber officinale]|uniref:uncharacterized protein LOC122009316 isoform X2 n=1 Tax=Zingiber officinale TaxID=94328 RepID=UPI001C4B5A9C|nr:uncharacterized protein LOC122009316 isoform X2 [Zingiber officinale]
MEKVGDSQPSSSEPVSPTSNEMMKERQQRVLKVEAESSENCLEKIKSVLEKLRETSDIDTWREERDGTVMVWGYFDPEKLKIKLGNEAGDAIMSITDPTNSIHSDKLASFEYDGGECAAKNPAMPVCDFSDIKILSTGELIRETKEKSGCCCCIL